LLHRNEREGFEISPRSFEFFGTVFIVASDFGGGAVQGIEDGVKETPW